jgi:hypothetical protein
MWLASNQSSLFLIPLQKVSESLRWLVHKTILFSVIQIFVIPVAWYWPCLRFHTSVLCVWISFLTSNWLTSVHYENTRLEMSVLPLSNPCALMKYFNLTKWLSPSYQICRMLWPGLWIGSQRSYLCKIWDFHSGDYEGFHLLGCDAMWILWGLKFRRNILPSS